MNAEKSGFVRPKAVFAYDFDGTLAPGYMQNHFFIPNELGITADEFWLEAKALAKAHRGDEIHAFMHLMLAKARELGLDLSQEAWRGRGSALPLFPGISDWFDRQNSRAAELELDLEHFVISSGNRELIEGSAISAKMKRVYASAFIYDHDGVAVGVSLAVNYTNKTQFLFRINKGTLDEWDDLSINKAQRHEDRPVPFDRMVFFGDGATDVPSMRLVTDQGGYAVAVYEPKSETSCAAAVRLRDDGRARYAGPADYSEGGSLDSLAFSILTEIAGRAHSRSFVEWPDSPP